MAKNILAKPGTVIMKSGTSKDPDGNAISYNWWQYEEVGSYRKNKYKVIR